MKKSEFRKLPEFKNDSDDLFNTAWRSFKKLSREFDLSDIEIIYFLNAEISKLVNNSNSRFYITG
jgi:hypothetical protein